MNKGLINLWHENEDFYDILIDENYTLKSYNELLLKFLEDVVFLQDCKNETETEYRHENFAISGYYTDDKFDKKYKITVYGNLEYGSCSECDLIEFLLYMAEHDRKKAVKLILLNILQAASVKVEIKNNFDVKKEPERYMYEENIIRKIKNNWKDISSIDTDDPVNAFLIMYWIMYYLNLLNENTDEKISIISQAILLNKDFSKEEKEKALPYRASLCCYPMHTLINEIV